MTRVAIALFGTLLALGLSTVPAHAATTSAAVQPATLKTCYTGTNNTYEYYGWCNGTGPTSYRVIAYCTNTEAVYGVTRWDGDTRKSYASCKINGMDSTLDEDWGYLLCSASNGTGTYEGYEDRHGDISWMLFDWGNGNITTGGDTLCEYNVSNEDNFNPEVAGS